MAKRGPRKKWTKGLPPIQLSHDELLLLLGILRLPMPLALGENPTAGYGERTLDVALSSAMSGLLARGYLEAPPSDTAQPKVDSVVEGLVADSALAESCLIVATQRGAASQAVHYSLRGNRALAHTSPQERVHRFEPLAGASEIIERALAGMALPTVARSPLPFDAEADAMAQAVEAAAAGQRDAARGALVTAGVPAGIVEAFLDRLGTASAHHALVAVRDMQGTAPVAESVVVLIGAEGAWQLDESLDQPGVVQVVPLDGETLRARLAALVDQLAFGTHAPA